MVIENNIKKEKEKYWKNNKNNKNTKRERERERLCEFLKQKIQQEQQLE